MRSNSRLKKLIYSASAAALAVSIAGCGGGGSSSSGTIVPIQNTLHTYAGGDSWTYKVTGYKTNDGGITKLWIPTGTFSRSIQVNPVPSDQYDAMTITEGLNLQFTDLSTLVYNNLIGIQQNPPGFSPGVYQYFDTLEANGNKETGDPRPSGIPPDLDIFGPASFHAQQILPATFNATAGISSTQSYFVIFPIVPTPSQPPAPSPPVAVETVPTTNQEHFSLTVIGQQVVTTPAGTFNAWKCNVGQQFTGQGKALNGTAWWVPQLGSFVQMTSVETYKGSTLYLTYVLTSTSVVPPAGP